MKPVLSRSLSLYLLTAAVLSLSVLFASLSYFVRMQNAQAVEAERAMLSGEVAALKNHAGRVAIEYGWWEEAAQRTQARDFPWLYENLASAISTIEIYDLVTLVPVEGAGYGWSDAHATEIVPAPLLSSSDIAYIQSELIADHADGVFVTSRFVDLAGKPTLLTATIMADPDDRSTLDPKAVPMIIFGHQVGEDFFQSITNKYLLQATTLTTSADTDGAALELADDIGRSAGFLVWTPSRPGFATAKTAALPLALFVVVFMGLMLWVNKRSQAMAVRVVRSELEAKTAARTDRLTGLDNRHGFKEYVDGEGCTAFARDGQLAVIFVDLNGFKAINDTAGHAAGDGVLKEVANRFQSRMPEGARLARIGGDEFACVLTGSAAHHSARDVAAYLRGSLDSPIFVDGSEFSVGAAVGFAVASAHMPLSVRDLVHRADLAMYKAKEEGLLEPLEFYPELEADQRARRQMMDDLQAGFENGEIYVDYQPIVSAKTGKPELFEALARWHSPTRGQVPPDTFIQIAEEFGFIHELGYFVLRCACDVLKTPGHPPIAINVSPIQLQDPAICEKFLTILKGAGISPNSIEIELTETVLIDNPALAKTRLNELSKAGFRISLDDYGTGFSSLGYLREFPFNKVKIDGKFVAECGHDEAKNQILQSLSLLAGAHDLSVVAEGVETKHQADFLTLMGYDLLQGYYFGRPGDASFLPDTVVDDAEEGRQSA